MREPRERQSLRVSSFLFADESQLMLRNSNVNSVLLWFHQCYINMPASETTH